MSDDEWDEETLGKRFSTRVPLSTHCNVPLKAHHARAALNIPAPGQWIPRRNHLREEYLKMTKLAGDHHVHFLDLAKQQYLLLNHLLIPSSSLTEVEWKQQMNGSTLLWKTSVSALESLGDIQLPVTPPKFQETDLRYLYNHYLVKAFFEEGVLSSGSKSFKPSLWWKKTEDNVTYCSLAGLLIYITENLCLIKTQEGTTLVSRDHLLIISDLASQRYLLRLLSICEQTNENTSIPDPDYLDKLFYNGDLILYHGGNQSYKLIYGLEPYCASLLVGDLPVGTPQGKTFQQLIYEEQIQLAKRYNVVSLYLERTDLLNSLQKHPDQVSQVFGLYRIWGHPTVEPLDGASALKKIATQVRMLKIEESKAISTKFKEEFIIRYIRKYKHWPDLDCKKMSVRNVIRKAYESQGVYPKFDKNYSRKSLDLIEFKQCFPVDPKFDLIEMLSDKALSLNTPDLIEHLVTGRGVGTSIERSVLLRWLSTELHDPVAFLQFIDQYGFPITEKSMGIKEKEREGKVEARLFGLTTIFKRMYIVLTEAMLAEHLIPLFPEITMTDDELALDKKRYKFTKGMKGRVTLFTSLDFSKWNTNMREEETHQIFQDFDHLFGFNRVYTRTHEMFNDSFIYLLNGSYIPDYQGNRFLPNLGAWYGHLGGIEGLRQKGWTLWTVTLILLASELHPIRLQLMGQGDNQVLREIFPPDLNYERALEVHFEFLKTLNHLLSKVGPPLKLEETWTSRDLFIYGKYMIYKGAPLPMYGKRICRMFRLSNEDFPTLESTLSSLTANYSSALACSHHPGFLYFIYTAEAIGAIQLFLRSSYLQSHSPIETFSKNFTLKIPGKTTQIRIHLNKFFSSRTKVNQELLIKVMLLPRCLGGFPILNLPMSLLRGFPDEVNLAVSSLKLMYPHFNRDFQIFITKILTPPIAKEQSYQMIFEHPTALNLEIPPAPSEARRTRVVEFLQTTPRITNSYFRTFMQILQEKTEQPLLDYLSLAEPFNPRILGLIASATVEARARHIAGKLQKTKTISQLALQEGGKNIYTAICEAEINHLGSVLRIINTSNPTPFSWIPTKCSMTHAMELRNMSWNKEIVGVDCVSPYEFMHLERVSAIKECPGDCELSKGYVAISYARALTPIEMQNPLIMGPHTPYRGSVTRQKMTGFGDKLAQQADPLLTKTLKLFSLLGWAIPKEGYLSQLIQFLLKSRTDLDPQVVIPDTDQIAGSAHHRLQDERTGHGGAVVVLPNYGSKIVFDTFPLSEYSKGSANVNLMFQSFMSLSVVLLGWDLSRFSCEMERSVHLHVRSSCCVRPIREELMECSVPPMFPLLSDPQNPYLFVTAEKAFPPHLVKNNFPITMAQSRDPQICSDRLSAHLALEIVNILSPSLWNLRYESHCSQNLVINWALRCPLQYMLEHVAFYLILYFTPMIRNDTIPEFLTRVHEHVLNSPLTYWMQLTNLMFCPNLHHELVAAPYPIIISGNPCLTQEILAQNLRSKVAAIILVWTDPSSVLLRLRRLTICSTSFCGMNFHPALQILTQDFLTVNQNLKIQALRLNIMTFLGNPFLAPSNSYDSQCAYKYYIEGKRLVSGDTLDTLCKLATTISSENTQITRDGLTLPEAVISMAQYSRADLVMTETCIKPIPKETTLKYRSIIKRPAISVTTGPYKGLSLINHIPPILEGVILCMGDGSGGFTWSVLRYWKNIRVMYNSLSNPDSAIQQAPSIPYLPALAGWPDLERRLLPLTMVNEELSDITHPNFSTILVKRHCPRLVGMMCDAESKNYLNGSAPLVLAESVLKVASDSEAPWVIFKTYALSPRILRQQISLFLSLFKNVQILRSYFSSEGSTEVYIYAYNPGNCMKLVRETHVLRGFQVHNEVEGYIEEVILPSLAGHQPWDWSIIQPYTLAISPDMDTRLFIQLLIDLPLISRGREITYPQSVNAWIGETTMKRPAHPSLSKKSLESTVFTTQLLQRWITIYLITWGNASWEDKWNLDDQFLNLYLIWYRLVNGSWEFSLYNSEVPIQEGRDFKVWKVSNILNSKHLKVIHKGIILTLLAGLKVRKMSPGIHRGNLYADGTNIKPQHLAKAEWVRTHIQVSTTIVPPSRKQEELKSIIDILKEKKLGLRRYWKY
ncbi:RdRp [Hymenopteran rhabdo-related virus]|uniref:Replicase n=1 Tax=Hymenopteran rhabdo-related virus 46 TaxID=2847807 RepID=A0AAE9H0Y3_9RHAB|nr:RdRp [Hymenopteran rhabdo-related virus]UOS86047.1 RdRp [Hymenopteran rhabdo-related virus 46]